MRQNNPRKAASDEGEGQVLSPRDYRAEMKRIRHLCVDYVENMVPSYLKLSATTPEGSPVDVDVVPRNASHVISAMYALRKGRKVVCRAWMGVNIFHAYLVFFLPLRKADGPIELAELQRWFFYMLTDVGVYSSVWDADWEEHHEDGERFAALTLRRTLPQAFVEIPMVRGEVADSIVEVVNSVIQVADRNGIAPKTKNNPDLLPITDATV